MRCLVLQINHSLPQFPEREKHVVINVVRGLQQCAVSAVSPLLIVTLTTVTLTQCLLIIRMRRSRDRSETYAEATNSTTKTTDVPVSLNEAYGMTKITTEEVTYELVKLMS